MSHGSITHLTAIIDWVPTAIVVVDEGGKVAPENRQAERLFGAGAQPCRYGRDAAARSSIQICTSIAIGPTMNSA